MNTSFLDGRVEVLVGDLTKQDVDAIVNAANSALLGGGGVDGAIHAAAGPELLDACRTIRRTQLPGGLPTGEAVITPGFNLPAKHVIHTVGPVYGSKMGRDAELLAKCYESCLELADTNSIKTISFPSLSTGVFGYPKAEAAAVSSGAIEQALGRLTSISEVRLVFFSSEQAEIFAKHQTFSK